MYAVLRSLSWDQIRGWRDLEWAITRLKDAQTRGDAFEEFSYAYFKIHTQLYQVKDLWRFRDVPTDILDRLGTATKQDKGIDGVLLHEDGSITAYQSKFRVNRSEIPTQRELSTFYMVSDRADYRLVISNVVDLPSVVKERKDHGQILAEQLLALDTQFFSLLHEHIQGKGAPTRPVPAPRPYQANAVTSIVDGLIRFGRGQAILACGAGKTLIGKWVCDGLECCYAPRKFRLSDPIFTAATIGGCPEVV